MNYNIVVYPKFPRPSKTNMLDLGAWNTVQPIAKKNCQNFIQQDALDRSVKKSWKNVEENKLNKIWGIFIKFLDIIIQYQVLLNNLLESNLVLKCVLEDDV